MPNATRGREYASPTASRAYTRRLTSASCTALLALVLLGVAAGVAFPELLGWLR